MCTRNGHANITAESTGFKGGNHAGSTVASGNRSTQAYGEVSRLGTINEAIAHHGASGSVGGGLREGQVDLI